MNNDLLAPNDWDKAKEKDTAELRKQLQPNIDMKDFANDVIEVLKEHIKNGRVAHVALFITFHDGGNKYFCSTEDEPSRVIT